MWSDADHRRHLKPTPEALGDALLRTQLSDSDQAAPRPVHFGNILLDGVIPDSGLDLVAFGSTPSAACSSAAVDRHQM
jgi:hypothetical protein